MGFMELYGVYLKWIYQCYGLKQEQITVDEFTCMTCWVPAKRGKTPLVLLHGYGAEATIQWDKQIAAFSRHFDLFIPDLIFFGNSTTTDESATRSPVFQAQCVAKLLSRLKVQKYHLVGYSYGGSIAYELATDKQEEEVLKLVVMDSGIIYSLKDFEEAMARLGVNEMSEMQPKDVDGVKRMLKLAYHKPPWVPDFVLKQVLKTMQKSQEQGSNPAPTSFSSADDEKERLAKEEKKREELNEWKNRLGNFDINKLKVVQKATLIVVGEFDPLFPVPLAEKLRDFIGERAQVSVIKCTAHMPQAERPREVNKAVLDFLLK